MSRWVAAAAVGLGIGAGLGCAAAPASRISRDDAIVQLTSNVRDAQVFVDGRFVAPLDAIGGGFAVAPGVHRVELRREAYFSGYLELTLARAERRRVALELAPILP